MIDKNKALSAFKEKFSKMTYEEQEAYLKKMGLTFKKKADQSQGFTVTLNKSKSKYKPIVTVRKKSAVSLISKKKVKPLKVSS